MPDKRFTRCLFLVLLISSEVCLWSQPPETVTVTGNFSDVPTLSVLRYLEENFTVRFYYQDAWFNQDTMNVRFSNHTLAEAMDIMLRNKPYTYRIISKNQIVFLPRAEVAMLAGQIPNYSNNNGSEADFTLIGNLNEAGRSKTAAVIGNRDRW